MAAKVISKKKGHCLPSAEDGQSAVGIGVDLRRKIRSLGLQFMSAGLYGCSYTPLLLNLIRLANPLLKYANVCGPLDLCAMAHRLRTSGVSYHNGQIAQLYHLVAKLEKTLKYLFQGQQN